MIATVAAATMFGATLAALTPTAAFACSMAGPPAVTFEFTGTATTADPVAKTMEFTVDEVHGFVISSPQPRGTLPPFPDVGEPIVVRYSGEVDTLVVGERYRVKAYPTRIPDAPWYSGTLDHFLSGTGCGSDREASTTYADGTKIQHPLWTLARRAQANPRLFAVPVAVVLTIAVVLLVRRGRQRPRVRSAHPSN